MKTSSVFFCASTRLCRKSERYYGFERQKNFRLYRLHAYCSGATERQVQAISAAIQEFLKKSEIKPLGVEVKLTANGFCLIMMTS